MRARATPPPSATREAGPSVPEPVPPVGVEAAAPKLRIHGHVLDATGFGVEATEIDVRAWSGKEPDVRWYTATTTTGLGGAFEITIDRERAATGFGLATTAKGYVEGWKAVKIEEYDEARGVDIVVDVARSIVGRVVDDDGRGIPGAVVQLWYGSETTWPTKTDAEGRFATPPHAPRMGFELIVEAPGYSRRAISIAASSEETTDVGDIAFRKGGWVSGVVVDQRGTPIGDLWIEVEQVKDKEGKQPRVRTDASGRFQFDDIDGKKVTIRIDGGTGRDYRGQLSEVDVGRSDLRLVASSWTMISLRFIDADTRAPVDLKKIEYGLRPEGTPEPQRLGMGAAGSDLVSTVLSAQSERRYDLTVRAAGFEDETVRGIDVGDVAEKTIDVLMRRKR